MLDETTDMQAVVCVEPGQLEVQTRPAPARDDGLVQVRVRCIGVCGTDFHIYKGLHPFLEYPRVMGHELSGEVAWAPEGSSLSVGTPVIFNPYLACGACVACRRGKPNCCTDISVLGVHADGGMCEFVNVPEDALYPADGLTLQQAAMVEFLSIGAHGVRRGRVREGDNVLVVGAGPIGLGAGLFARIAGARVSFLDISEARIRTAQGIVEGADGFVVGENTLAEIEAATDGDLFHAVIDATGNRRAMEASMAYVCHGGTLIYVSVVKDDITFSDPLFHSREMTLVGSRNATREDFEHVIASIKAGHIPTEAINTHSCTLVEAPTAIPAWLDQQDVLIKAIVEVG